MYEQSLINMIFFGAWCLGMMGVFYLIAQIRDKNSKKKQKKTDITSNNEYVVLK